jgi:hypothetical protein
LWNIILEIALTQFKEAIFRRKDTDEYPKGHTTPFFATAPLILT